MKNKVSCLYIYVYVVLVRDLIDVCNILSFDIYIFYFKQKVYFVNCYFMYWVNIMYVIFIIQVIYNYKFRLEK